MLGDYSAKPPVVLLILAILLTACSSPEPDIDLQGDPSPYLFVFAGDEDENESDFLAVIDVDPMSETRGLPLSSVPIGHRMSLPHHMEYVVPPKGEPIFMNSHHHEISFVVDVSDPMAVSIEKEFLPPSPLRYPHDYERTPSGTRLVGYLRSDNESPDQSEKSDPGGDGGIAEYTIDGELIRSVSAAVPGLELPVRPYAFALLPEQDRFLVTSAPMHETSWADVVQIYRYSDFQLLHTIELPAAILKNGNEIKRCQPSRIWPSCTGRWICFS